MSVYYDSSKYTVDNTTYNTTGGNVGGAPTGPLTVNSTGPYVYMGCYSEGSNGRALTGMAPATPDAGGSVEYCENQCAAGKYQYFGVEYANECYVSLRLSGGTQSSTDLTSPSSVATR